MNKRVPVALLGGTEEEEKEREQKARERGREVVGTEDSASHYCWLTSA